MSSTPGGGVAPISRRNVVATSEPIHSSAWIPATTSTFTFGSEVGARTRKPQIGRRSTVSPTRNGSTTPGRSRARSASCV